MIRPAKPADAAAICAIYNYYIENSSHTFEEKAVTQEEMEGRIIKIGERYTYLVSVDGSGEINGYAYVNTWKERSSYRFTVELSIFVSESCRGKGIGSELMEKLLGEIRKTDIHTVISGIVLPNDGSVALHEKFGFKKAGHFFEAGKKFGKWHDVGYWELIIRNTHG